MLIVYSLSFLCAPIVLGLLWIRQTMAKPKRPPVRLAACSLCGEYLCESPACRGG